MQIGMIGLGKMGAKMAQRLLDGGHTCVVHDIQPSHIDQLQQQGALAAYSLADLKNQLSAPRVVWVMLPAGQPTQGTMEALAHTLEAGDIVIDGGNSYYKDDRKQADRLQQAGIHFVDVGTSGGVWGKERGYCLMIGADRAVFEHCEPLFQTLAPGAGDLERTAGEGGPLRPAEQGYLHCGPVGAGHYVKMIHNGIEYGLMQAYAEGFDILKGSSEFSFNLKDIAEVWRRGSVIGSWLLDLTAMALEQDPELDSYTGQVGDSGEGRWAVQAAVESGVSAEVLSTALFKRFRSRQDHSFAEKTLSAMRFQFGGHVEK
ncbi:MAG: decarboxylating 6-phosphogluconate dehydrogenase [Myxococcaceae bacterium]|nr:decarboxylating 6-phosphogluconate dehydrogenase [Myxococcaceae bacterium]MBH2005782.1 decarboxylating 6-phosphogluconate dehydrogenase [Myxococcaceae bacterium]